MTSEIRKQERSKRVAMIQSNYLPWKGYFDIIHDVDLFIFYDDVQYTKEDWRNRNRIKTPNGIKWLTVPCGKGTHRRVCDVVLPDPGWQKTHWSLIIHCYERAPYFPLLRPLFEEFYLGAQWRSLSEMNQSFIRMISRDILGIHTAFGSSENYALPADMKKEDRWLDLVRQTGSCTMVIGPTARDYLDREKEQHIAQSGIHLVWKDYSGYPEYPQLYPPFEHRVSIIDLLFHCGPDAPFYIWGWRDGSHTTVQREENGQVTPFSEGGH